MGDVTRFPGSPLTKEDMKTAIDGLETCIVIGWNSNDLVITTTEPDVASVNLWLDMAKSLILKETIGD